MADKNNLNPEQESLFREIDEDLRQENLAKFWKKYGNALIGMAVLLVVAVAGYKGWQAWDKNRHEAAATQFLNAIGQAETGKQEDALTALAALKADAPGGYALLAAFREAAVKLKQGDKAGAAAAYNAIAADTAVDALYRDLADVLAALIEVDSADPAEIRTRMARIGDDANPWRFSAREIGGLAALRAGDVAEARKIYDALAADAATPNGLRQRAEAMAQQLKD